MTSGDNSGNDPFGYRKSFAVRVQGIVQRCFASPTDLAKYCNADLSTAENWWNGDNAPQGWVIGYLISHPVMGPEILQALKSSRNDSRKANSCGQSPSYSMSHR